MLEKDSVPATNKADNEDERSKKKTEELSNKKTFVDREDLLLSKHKEQESKRASFKVTNKNISILDGKATTSTSLGI